MLPTLQSLQRVTVLKLTVFVVRILAIIQLELVGMLNNSYFIELLFLMRPTTKTCFLNL